MLNEGLLKEINDLISLGYKDKIMKSNVIGYAELIDYLDSNISLDEAIAMIKQNSRRYAKRQMTWFRKQEEIEFFENSSELITAVDFSRQT